MANETTKKLLWGALALGLVAGGIGLMVWVNQTAAELKATQPSEPPVFLAGTPPAYLYEYVQGDFKGERLEAANKARYKERVLWPTEPNWETAAVIRSFRMQSGPTTRTEASIEVTYDTLGELNLHDYTYRSAPKREILPFVLVPGQERYKIVSPILKPHVGAEAAIAFLERMSVNYQQFRPNIQRSIERIKADVRSAEQRP